MTKKIHIQYFALLREERKKSSETITTSAVTLRDLYKELKNKYHFRLDVDILKVAVNDEFVQWNRKLKTNDRVIFIPPVAGG